jgi:hypothetical protein
MLCQCSMAILQQYFYKRDWISTVCKPFVKNSTETTSSSYYRINTQSTGISQVAEPFGCFGSCLYGGLEFASLETTQGAGKIQLLLRHFRTPGQPHDIALVVVDRFQYNAGVGFHILEDTKRDLPHLEGIWIPTVRAYLATINGLLQIAESKLQPLQRHGDHYIMDAVLASRLFKTREIKFINYCRLYLQVLSFSDMFNAQGNALAVGIYDGY